MGKNGRALLPACALCVVTVFGACSSTTNEEIIAGDTPAPESEEKIPSPVPEPATEESESPEMTEEEPMEEHDEEHEVAFRFPNEWVPADGLGEGILQPLGDAALPEGFVEEEYLFAGEAVSYVPEGPVSSDGFWSVTEGSTAAYKTRMIFRYPHQSNLAAW